MKRILIIIALITGIAQADQQKDLARLTTTIQTANVAQFKSAYDLIDTKQVLQPYLLELAHNTKKELATNLESWGNSTINKKKLAIGTLQALGVVYCLAQIGYVAYGAIMPLQARTGKDGTTYLLVDCPKHVARESNLVFACIKYPASVIHIALHGILEIGFGNDNGKYATATVAPALCTLSAYGAYKAFNASAKNIKQGLNYKAHLETQINNIDEIITYIQNPTVTHVTQEQA